MRRIVSVGALLAALALASTVLAAAATAGSTIRVSATVPLTFSGQYVTAGATYDVTARGYVITAKIPYYHVPGEFKSASGPAGQPNQPCLADYQNDVNGRCMVVDANFGTRVGVIIDDMGATAGTVEIGDGPTFVAPVSGWLFLAVNDLDRTYYDNNGQFEVVIAPQ